MKKLHSSPFPCCVWENKLMMMIGKKSLKQSLMYNRNFSSSPSSHPILLENIKSSSSSSTTTSRTTNTTRRSNYTNNNTTTNSNNNNIKINNKNNTTTTTTSTINNHHDQNNDDLFNFIPKNNNKLDKSSPSSPPPRATISRSADDYLLVMQSIISSSSSAASSGGNNVDDGSSRTTKHSIPSSLYFSIDGTKYRVRWWLSMLTSFGEQFNREKMEMFSKFLLNNLFVYPEKRNEVLARLYGYTTDPKTITTITTLNNNNSSQSSVKSVKSVVAPPAVLEESSIVGGGTGSIEEEIISLSDLIKFYKSFEVYDSEEIEMNFVKELRMVCKSQLLTNYTLLKDLDMVRHVFDSIRVEEGTPSIQHYNQMMSALANLSSNASEDSKTIIQEIESLYSEIATPNNQCIHTMLHAYAKFGMYIEMEELAKQLEHKNSYTFSILLYGYVVAKRFSKALEVYSTISKPASEHIRLVVSLLLQVGLDIQGERLIGSLPESIHKLRLTNELMDLYTKSGDFESVIRIFHSLLEPDCYSLGIVMNAYVRQHKIDDSLQLFEKYCKSGKIQPNSIIYNLLLHGISLKGSTITVGGGGVLDFEKFYHQIPKQFIDQKTIVTMISAYIKRKDYRKSEQIYLEHKSNILKDSIYASTLMIKCYALMGRIESAEAVYTMVKKPDLVLCNIMLDCYSKRGDMKKAYNLFSTMYKRDIVSYNTILKGYAEKGNLNNAENIFHRIDDPDAQSHLIMLNALAEYGDAESVETFFKMIPKQFKNAYIYTCMMKFYSKLNRVERVKHYYGLVGSTAGNNFHADHLMLNTFLRNEDFDSMRQLDQKMKGKYLKKRDAQSRAILDLLKHIPSNNVLNNNR